MESYYLFYTEIVEILGILNNKIYIYTSLYSDRVLEAELVRLKFIFFVNQDSRLESQKFHIIINKNQQLDCMIGLRNKLILQSTDAAGYIAERTVLILFGSMDIWSRHEHVEIYIKIKSTTHMCYFKYYFDNHLKILQFSQNFTGHLFQVFLYAITIFCLADPFTDRTGTKKTLSKLRKQYLYIYLEIADDTQNILQDILYLTLYCFFYSKHLRNIQQVK